MLFKKDKRISKSYKDDCDIKDNLSKLNELILARDKIKETISHKEYESSRIKNIITISDGSCFNNTMYYEAKINFTIMSQSLLTRISDAINKETENRKELEKLRQKLINIEKEIDNIKTILDIKGA